ncbi:unnamed protein product [Sphagnum jensenii]|uniref:Exocyst subunit Exo70 family protein n=1 Tax=Sphagnum jensenii TaxID=128206 RepID=A0ABP0X2C0_9BRYO
MGQLELDQSARRAAGRRSFAGGTAGGGGRTPHEQQLLLDGLLATRQKLQKAVENTQELGTQIEASERRLEILRMRHAPLKQALAPLQLWLQASNANGVGIGSRPIERAIAAASSLLKMFNVMHSLERVLCSGEQPRKDLDAYLAAMMQLEEAMDYLKHNHAAGVRSLQAAVKQLQEEKEQPSGGGVFFIDSYRRRHLHQSLVALQAAAQLHHSEEEAAPELLDAGLLAMALKHLEGEFKRLVQEHSRVMELPATLMPSETSLEDMGAMDLLPPAAGFPPEVIQKLQAILERVGAHNRHHSCLKVYQETRSTQTRLSLQALHVQYLKNITPDLVDGVEWEELQNMIGLWIQHLQLTVKVLYAHERRLACVVFKDLGQSVWAECVGKLAYAGMTAFLQFGEAVAHSRRSPEKLCGLLDMFDAMEKSAKSILRVFDGETDGIRSRFQDLQKQVVYGASKTFREISRWIELQNYPLGLDGRVTQLSSYVVNYLKYLVLEYSSPINKVLRIEHSWHIDEDQPEEMDLSTGILHFMQALERHLEARSKEYSNAALRHIFMMNNLYYVRTRAKKSKLGPLLSETWLSDLGRKVEQHALWFQKEAWQPVLVHLSRDGLSLSSGGRSATRELVRQRLRSFASAFEDTCLTQSKWIIPEEDLRVGTQLAVVQAVVPGYRSYLQNFGSFVDSHASFPNKHVKYSPEVVERMLGELFIPVKAVNGNNRHKSNGNHQV